MVIKAITYDLKYFFTNKGIVRINENLEEGVIKYNFKNLQYGIKILKENIQFKFNLGMISKDEYMFSSRKFLYEMISKINSKNGFSLLSEWEKKYSQQLLTESYDKTEIAKSYNFAWYGVEKLFKEKISNLIIQEGFWGNVWGGVQSAAKWGWDNIKNTVTKAMTCTSGQGAIDCFMEGLRTIATSILGVAVLTGVSFIPAVGEIPNIIIFGSLLIYDIWKMMSGKEYKVVDIIVDIVSLLTPLIAKGLGSLLKGVTNFYSFGKLAAASSLLKTFVPTLAKGLGVIGGIISKTVGFFSVKLGIKWIADMSNSTSGGLTKVSENIIDGYESKKEELEKDKEKINTQLTKKDIEDLDDEDLDDEDLDDLDDEDLDDEDLETKNITKNNTEIG